MKKFIKTILPVLMTFLFPLVVGAQEIVERVYYENGNIESIAHCSGDEVYVVSYYENGNIKEKSFYVENLKNGKFEKWHENGGIQLSAEYTDNQPSGEWKSYNEKGLLIGRASFTEGLLYAGSIWDDNGKIIATR